MRIKIDSEFDTVTVIYLFFLERFYATSHL